MKGKLANGVGSQYPSLPRNMVYPTLLPLMRTPRLTVVDLTDAPADLNGLVLSPKDKIWFLRMCHHISNAVYRIWMWLLDFWENFCAAAVRCLLPV